MRRLAASSLAWSLAALSVMMFVAAIALHVLARSRDSPGEWSTLGTVGQVLSFLPFLAFPLVGALVASSRPRNWVGWILLAVRWDPDPSWAGMKKVSPAIMVAVRFVFGAFFPIRGPSER